MNVNYRYGADEIALPARRLATPRPSCTRPTSRDGAATRPTARRRAPRPRHARDRRARTRPRSRVGARPARGRQREPDGDDLIFLYTGGTTGHAQGRDVAQRRPLRRAVADGAPGHRAARPGRRRPRGQAGRHRAARVPAHARHRPVHRAVDARRAAAPSCSSTGAGLDAERVWDEVERNARRRCSPIVGDVFARPLLAALDAQPDRWDLSTGCGPITSSGVTWSPETKAGLLAPPPARHAARLARRVGRDDDPQRGDGRRREIKPARFAVNDRVRVLDEATGRAGRTGERRGRARRASAGRIPLGYYNDPEKTAQTFRIVDGVRYSIPGDYATVDADGTIRLLGRGSACINTGGEKVYPEEVELVLREHRGVSDCVVVGVPDERFGELVVALVEPDDRMRVDGTPLDGTDRRGRSRADVVPGAPGRATSGRAGSSSSTPCPLRRRQGRLPLPQGSRRAGCAARSVRRRCRRIRCRRVATSVRSRPAALGRVQRGVGGRERAPRRRLACVRDRRDAGAQGHRGG